MSYFDFDRGLNALIRLTNLPQERIKLIFLTFLQVREEKRIFEKGAALSFDSIKKTYEIQVSELIERPLLVNGCLIRDKEAAELPYSILVSDDDPARKKLVTLIHEILHLFFINEDILYPNEEELDRVAELLVTNYFEQVEKWYQEIVTFQPSP